MKKPTIFIVDDMAAYLDSLKRALSNEFEILTALSFEEAKQKISNNLDILLIDICLDETKPGIDKGGVEILKWIKQNYPDRPVVMMSAYSDFNITVECLNLGANKFLKKPINLIELRKTLNELIENI